MSNPADRLLGDTAAERLHLEALSVLAAAPLIPNQLESLAVGIVAFAQDRQARIELAAVQKGSQ